VTLETEEKIKNVFSTTHSIATVYKSDKKAVTSWEANDVTPVTDFKLYFMLAEAEFGVSLLAYRQQPEDGFFFLDINPGFWDSKNTKVPKDITFILDVSGSMAGDKLAKAKNALLYCLSALSGEDRFALIKFSTEAEVFLDRIVPADTANLGRAKDFINNLIAVGGTNIEDALSLALSLNAVNDETRAQLIVFITDGKPTIGETDADRLVAKIKKSNTHNMRIFTVGIDTSLDTILLDKITTATRAYRAYISPKEDIETKIKAFYQKLDAPVFAHISLSIAGNVQLFKTEPKLTELPDLFLGTSLTLLGRYRGDGKATITVKGIVGNRSAEFTYELSFPAADTKYDTIPPLWASRRVGFLLEQMRLYGESKEVVDEIILLARTHGIITPYTSYLILEDETGRVTRNELSRRDQTLRNVAPEGSEFEKKSKTEFDSLKEESGTGAVTASGEVQALRNAQANDVAKSSLPRLSAKDKNGKDINIQSQVKNIKGRAFYNSGVEWNDSNIQNRKIKNTKRIQFASKEYFDLLAKNPETNAYLSLGKNVRFMVGDDLYEIFE
jgi:Ca-activated chloride channel family protein